jgi:predicted cytidylate kinase
MVTNGDLKSLLNNRVFGRCMRITISGMPGSGKTTVAKIIAERLKLKHYYMGAIRRHLAQERGITLDELNRIAESDPESDRMVDDFLVKLGKTEDGFIAEGRTAAHFIPNSIRLFIAVDIRVGAERIWRDIREKGHGMARNEKLASSVAEQVKLTEARISSDKLRYKKYYNIDIFDPDMYDLWIDTTDMTVEQVVDKIISFVKSYRPGSVENAGSA